MATALLGRLTVPATSKHTATVIFLHGLGDTGHGWEPVARMLARNEELNHIKWILPHAPSKVITGNMGMTMPAWFDIASFDSFEKTEDEDGMLDSRRSISAVITEEVASGIPANRVLLGGFSQGGAMSLLTGLTSDYKLAGLAVLSGWLPLRTKFKTMAREDAASTNIFWGYGSADPLVKPEFGQQSMDFLQKSMGFQPAKALGEPGLKCEVYAGIGHTTNIQELKDLETFIKKSLPKLT